MMEGGVSLQTAAVVRWVLRIIKAERPLPQKFILTVLKAGQFQAMCHHGWGQVWAVLWICRLLFTSCLLTQ